MRLSALGCVCKKRKFDGMIFIQMTGLSGAGKSTLAEHAMENLRQLGHQAEVVDGDAYRKTVCRDLGFTRADRLENIRRLGEISWKIVQEKKIAILAAINPYEEGRSHLRQQYGIVKTVWIDCPLDILEKRDTKGLYRRAHLPPDHPGKVNNLTGVNDPFDTPVHYDLKIDTDAEDVAASAARLTAFILDAILSSSLPLYTSYNPR